jgi:hypothetical protein
MADVDRAVALARRLESWADERAWCGPDPYEGLNASRVPRRLTSSALGRRLLIQTVKRSPVDLRAVLGIQPQPDAATVAMAASAYARNGFLSRDEVVPRLRRALDQLETLRSPRYREPCWGYHFEFQSRVVHYLRGEPNTIATAFAGHALLDAHRTLVDESLLDRAAAVGDFFVNHIAQTPARPGACFGYHPGDGSLIHNSNMLVCALLARLLAAGRGDQRVAEAANAALEFTVARQRDDGSWPYGERSDLAWIDNFHTGYVLDALAACADCGLQPQRAERAWRAGVDFYRERLFLSDGTPKYTDRATFPIDSQCVAQGIQTLTIAARRGVADPEDPWRVFAFARRRMLRRDGIPVFQRRRLWVNRAPHLRWTVAPWLRALSELLRAPVRA